MNLSESYKKRLLELAGINNVFYHGTYSVFPFEKFDPKEQGRGIVSNGQKYGGFFFSSDFQAAEWFTEWFVCQVKINGLKPNPLPNNHPPTVLQQALQDNAIYFIKDYMDGGSVSNTIVVVPKTRINDIKIIKWTFVGDEESYFETLNRKFNINDYDEDDEEYTPLTQEEIAQVCAMTEMDLDYMLTVDIFRKWYESKPEG